MTLQESYERQLLGRIIEGKDCFMENSDRIVSELFCVFQDVFEAYLSLVTQGKHPSLAKLLNTLPERKSELATIVRDIDHSIPLIGIIEELEEQKNLRMVNDGIARAVSTKTSEEKVKVLTDTITGLYRNQKAQYVDGFTAAKDALKMNENKKVIETPSGFAQLDATTGGLHKGDLWAIGAETSQGKTAFVLNMAQNVLDAGKSAAFISLEMSERQIMERMICSKAEIPRKEIPDNLEAVQRAASAFASLKFYIADVTNNSAAHIMGLIRSASIRYNVDVVVVDYLQLISDKSQKSREQEIGQTARSLKNIAKELNITVVALSQLSRAGRGQGNYPTLSRLRDSGQVEEAADLVLFIYRPESYGIEQDDMGESTEGKAEIIIAKGRSYGTGKFTTRFNKDITKFCDL